jgi:membrane protease YdiL (CAAX protease family)
MLENQINSPADRNPYMNVIIVFLIVAIGFVVVGPLIGLIVALPFYSGSMEELFQSIGTLTTDPGLKIPFYIMQGFATLIGLIVGPALLLQRDQNSLRTFFTGYKFEIIPVLVTFFIVVAFMAVNSVFIEWNSNFDFPDFANGFETWAREREDAATVFTEFLTNFDSPLQLIIAMIVIAVLPAIGEEVVFRGMIQNELFRGTRNVHLSIWISAILFSAMHFQFFGFVPRVLLGALFGYLYYWSGSLMMAIVAHFVNNGISVMAMYFYQKGAFEFDLESTQAAPANVVIFSALVTGGLLFYFYKYFEHRKPALPKL